MGLSCTVSERDVDIHRKSQNFLTPVYFMPPLGITLELGIGSRGQKLEWWGYQMVKKVSR